MVRENIPPLDRPVVVPWGNLIVHHLELYFVLTIVVLYFTGVILAEGYIRRLHEEATVTALTSQRDDLRNEITTLKERLGADEFDIAVLSGVCHTPLPQMEEYRDHRK
jgi:hypothetical protein